MSAKVLIKICGITSPEDARAAAEAGADAIGLVLWPGSPRCVTIDAAARIVEALPPTVRRVGVFVDPSAEEMALACERIGLDVVQLHGTEDLDLCASASRPVWKAVRVGKDFAMADALRYEGHVSGLLLDADRAAQDGGRASTFDWTRARAVREQARFLIVAGGLTPENVGEAVSVIRPDGVDVSRGVETAPGKKDHARVRAFVEAIRRVV